MTQSSDANEIADLRTKAPDYKETMEIGRDWDKTWWNCWPPEDAAPGFKSTMLDFFRTCHELHVIVMRAIALGLDLEEGFFDDKIDQQYHNLRLLSYPSIKTSLLADEGQARAGAHSGTVIHVFRRVLCLDCLRLRYFNFAIPGHCRRFGSSKSEDRTISTREAYSKYLLLLTELCIVLKYIHHSPGQS